MNWTYTSGSCGAGLTSGRSSTLIRRLRRRSLWAGERFTSFLPLELIFLVGPVPTGAIWGAGTPEMGDRVGPFLADHEAMLRANHGAVTLGRTLDEAWIRRETLEHAARILIGARVLGRVTALDPGAVAQLEAPRARSLREQDV